VFSLASVHLGAPDENERELSLWPWPTFSRYGIVSLASTPFSKGYVNRSGFLGGFYT
jgi:hypothetical protein